MVDAQMESLEAPDHYDALSADVIRPAFRYHRAADHHHHHRKPAMGLGSAAISSVTTALSPILPFTGGIDLRREDYWTNGWFGSVSSVVQQVRDAFAGEDSSASSSPMSTNMVLQTPRGGGAATATKTRSIKNNSKKYIDGTKGSKIVSSRNVNVLSSTEPFAPLKEIAELTLKDVAMTFRFAVENTRKDFDSGKFMSGLLPRAKKVVDRMASATSTARGKGVSPPITGEVDSPIASGDIDALSFCSAMRVFAEWRVLRQVPPGYKGYAVGMSLGQKDIVQNIAKIEQGIQNFVDYRVEHCYDDDDNIVTSPTLRDLLQYEVEMDIHDNTKLPRLKEKSAAMGLLWVRRQLQYQTAIFANVIDSRFESTRAAVQSAYDEVYNSYHGWAVQKIFSYSFQAAPDATEIYKYMNPHRLEEVQVEAHARFSGDGTKHRSRSFGQSEDDSLENPLDRFGRHIGKEWDKFAGNVVQEWDKLAQNVGQLFGQPQRQPKEALVQTTMETSSSIVHGDADKIAANELDMENFINQEMEHDAYEHIRAYLEVAGPLLADLENLFDEFNMDDPTKV
jgi:hypothetical protein